MDSLRLYDIDYKALADGVHEFEFTADDTLFSSIENSLIPGGELRVALKATKSMQMLKLHFDIDGTLRLTCDVCLDDFDYKVEALEGDIVMKFGDHYEELTDELVVIDEQSAESINVAQWIYEIVASSLPIRIEHPLDEEGDRTCNPEMLEQLARYTTQDKNDDSETEVDPRWEKLKGLIDKEQ
ncbi:MAG: DUF177 domain-containing protein [Marinilabiliaceae bacterium]|nr:DUF177 domain-containing protein [Marinilabiliaceae bacterium]